MRRPQGLRSRSTSALKESATASQLVPILPASFSVTPSGVDHSVYNAMRITNILVSPSGSNTQLNANSIYATPGPSTSLLSKSLPAGSFSAALSDSSMSLSSDSLLFASLGGTQQTFYDQAFPNTPTHCLATSDIQRPMNAKDIIRENIQRRIRSKSGAAAHPYLPPASPTLNPQSPAITSSPQSSWSSKQGRRASAETQVIYVPSVPSGQTVDSVMSPVSTYSFESAFSTSFGSQRRHSNGLSPFNILSLGNQVEFDAPGMQNYQTPASPTTIGLFDAFAALTTAPEQAVEQLFASEEPSTNIPGGVTEQSRHMFGSEIEATLHQVFQNTQDQVFPEPVQNALEFQQSQDPYHQNQITIDKHSHLVGHLETQITQQEQPKLLFVNTNEQPSQVVHQTQGQVTSNELQWQDFPEPKLEVRLSSPLNELFGELFSNL